MNSGDSHKQEADGSGFLMFLGISLLLHALFFACVLFLPDFEDRSRELPPSITVDLVSLKLPAEKYEGVAGGQEPVAVKPPVKKKKLKNKVVVERKKAVKKKPPVPETKKKVRKVKKRTVTRKVKDSSRVIDSAMERLKSKVESEEKQQPERTMKEALSRLEKKVAGEKSKGALSTETPVDPLAKRLENMKSETALGGGVSLPGQGHSGGGGSATLEDVYRHNVAEDVKNAWAFPDHLASGAAGLLTEVSFDVLPGGELADIRVSIRSGNKYLDESAVNAVKKASPFAPHLAGISKSVVRVRVHFAPKPRE